MIERITFNYAGKFGIMRVKATKAWDPGRALRVVVRKTDVGEFTLEMKDFLYCVPGVWVARMDLATRPRNSQELYDFRTDDDWTFEILR